MWKSARTAAGQTHSSVDRLLLIGVSFSTLYTLCLWLFIPYRLLNRLSTDYQPDIPRKRGFNH